MSNAKLFLDNYGLVRKGVRRLVHAAKPAVGAEWTVTVPGGVQWRPLMGYAQATTGATAGTRNFGLTIQFEGNSIFFDKSATGIGASSTANLHMLQGLVYLNALTFAQEVWCNIPTWLLDTGTVLTSALPGTGSGLTATDQYTNVVLLVDEYYFTNSQLADVQDTTRFAHEAGEV